MTVLPQAWRLPVFVAALLALSGLTLTLTRVTTDMSVFLPRAADPMQRLFSDELRSGTVSRTVLIGLRTDDRDIAAEASRFLYAELAPLAQFTSIANGSQDLSDAEREFLMRYRYLFSPRWKASTFTEPGLREAFDEQLHNLRSALAPLAKQTLAADPTGEFWSMLQDWLPPSAPAMYDGVWVSGDERTAVLVAQLAASSVDLDGQQQALETIRQIAARAPDSARVQLLLSGPPVFATSSRTQIASEITLLSTLATLLVILILWRVYRSARLVLLGALPVLTGALVGTLSVGAVYGEVHGVALAFGTTILGVAIDYPIHFFSHLRVNEPAGATIRRLWSVMLLGCATTVIGYSAMLFSGFDGLTQIGVFAATGLLAAALTTRLALPWLMPDAPTATNPWPPPGVLHRLHAIASPGANARGIRIAGAVVATLLVASVLAPFDWWSDDIKRLNTVTAAQRDIEGELRSALGTASVRYFVVVKGTTEQLALETSETAIARLDALVASGALAGYDAVARHVPSIRNQMTRQRELPAGQDVAATVDRIIPDFPFRHNTFEPFIADIEATRQLVAARLDDFPDGALKGRLQSLLRPLDRDWIALMPLHEPLDPARIADEIQKVKSPGIQFLDLQSVAGTLLHDYRVQAMTLVAIGWLLLWGALALSLHSVTAATLTTLPAAIAVVLTMALLHLVGVSLTLFHCVALLLVAGLALDYALFFFRPGVDSEERERTLRAIVVCAVTTVAVFALLAMSSVPVLRMMGTTVTLGVVLAFAATLTLARGAHRAL